VLPDCPISDGGTVITCSGDQSAGIDLDTSGTSETLTTLNVNNLTANIAPAANVTGVHFAGNGQVIVNVDMGPWKIITTSDGTPALSAGNLTLDTVDVNFVGTIETTGDFAEGIVVFTAEGDQFITVAGSITTEGTGAHAISGASMEGGISIISDADLKTTGSAAGGIYVTSQDGDIAIAATGNISVANGIGISAQSINGDIGIASGARISAMDDYAIGISAQTGGDIGLQISGTIETKGESGMGIHANSFAGGVALANEADIITRGDEAHAISLVAGGASGGIAAVSVGNITTYGEGARGIFMQTAGSALLGIGGAITTYGDLGDGAGVRADGDVIVLSAAEINTHGDDAFGIYAESVEGSATVVSTGDVTASGMGSIGVSVTADLNASLLNFGAISGGYCCPGVMLTSNSGDTQLVNYGTISALSGTAIDVAGATNTIENYGTVTGSVLTYFGDTTFTNYSGALFNTGMLVAAQTVTNHGTVSPGGHGKVEATLLDGVFVQSAGGRYAVDIDGETQGADTIIATGSAELAGTVVVSLLSAPTAAAEQYLILMANAGVTDSGLGLLASPALNARLLYPDEESVVLGLEVNFALPGLNRNQLAIANVLNRFLTNGGPGGVDPVLVGLLNTQGVGAYRNALDQLSPAIYGDTQLAALYSSLAFSNSLMSCKVNGTDTASIIREGQCLWAGATARFLDNGTTAQQIGFAETAGLFTAGAQVALDDAWRLGFAAGYQSSSLSTATNAQSDGSMAQVGIALKYNPGPLLLAGSISGGGAWYDTTRPMNFGGFSSVADSSQDLGIVAGALRAAYVFGSPHLYLKPALDVGLTYVDMGAFTENTAGGAGLSVAGGSNTVFTLAPTIEAGTEWWLANGTLVRPLVRGGLAWYEGADIGVTASFAAAPLADPFTISTGTSVGVDDVMGLVGAGIDMINGADSVFRFAYDGQLGSNTQIHTVGIKGSSKF